MSDKKIIDDYLEGKLPFSELYRSASQDENCPDHLYTTVFNKAINKNLTKRKRIWLEAALLITALVVLFITLYAPSKDPELECPRDPVKQIP